MSTYVRLDGPLTRELKKGEMVIDFPTFTEELQVEVAKLAPGKKRTAINLLSVSLAAIIKKYEPTFDYSRIPHGNYIGREFDTVEEFSSIICEILRQYCPNIFRSAMDKKIKNRPIGINVIYYNGPFSYTDVFDRNGLQSISEDQIDDVLELKRSRVISAFKKSI